MRWHLYPQRQRARRGREQATETLLRQGRQRSLGPRGTTRTRLLPACPDRCSAGARPTYWHCRALAAVGSQQGTVHCTPAHPRVHRSLVQELGQGQSWLARPHSAPAALPSCFSRPEARPKPEEEAVSSRHRRRRGLWPRPRLPAAGQRAWVPTRCSWLARGHPLVGGNWLVAVREQQREPWRAYRLHREHISLRILPENAGARPLPPTAGTGAAPL